MSFALFLLAAAAPDFTDVSGVKVSCLENLRGKEGRARVELVVGSGALNEEEDERGVAHLLEHLVMRPLGFDHKNAATAWDYTTYYRDMRAAELSTAAIDLVRAVGTIDLAPFEVEREVVLREMELRGSREADMSMDPIFGGTILARDPGGTSVSVRNLTAEHVRAFHAKHYVRGNIGLAIRGAVSCEAILAALAPELAKLREGGAIPVPRAGVKEPGRRSLSAASAGGEMIQGFYWYDAKPADEVVLQLVAKHLEQRALDDLRKAKGLTYSPRGVFQRIGPGGMISVRVISSGRDRIVGAWYEGAITELRLARSPKEHLKAALPMIEDAIELDAVRAALSAIRGEESPREAFEALTDQSLRSALAELLDEERSFGTAIASTNVSSIVILVLFGIAVIGVLAYAGRMMMRR